MIVSENTVSAVRKKIGEAYVLDCEQEMTQFVKYVRVYCRWNFSMLAWDTKARIV